MAFDESEQEPLHPALSTPNGYSVPDEYASGVSEGKDQAQGFYAAAFYIDPLQQSLMSGTSVGIPLSSISPGGSYKFGDGTLTSPSISWINDPTDGFYRSGSHTFVSVINGNPIFTWNATSVLFSVGTNITLTGMTPGSVLFAGTSGLISQNNASFFWDTANTRLGVGTNAPASIFHVKQIASGITYDFQYTTSDLNVNGLQLKRSATNVPIGLSLWNAGTQYWAYALDFTTTDLVLAYDVQAGNDIFRMSQGTGCMMMTWGATTPSNTTRLQILSFTGEQAALTTLLDINASTGSPVTIPLLVRSTAAGQLIQLSNNASSIQNIGMGSGANSYIWLGPADGTGLKIANNGVVTAINELNVGTATDTAAQGDFVAGKSAVARMFYSQSNSKMQWFGSDNNSHVEITGAASGTGVKLIKTGDAGRNFLRWNQSTVTWQTGFRASPYSWVLEAQTGTSTPADDSGWTSCIIATTGGNLTLAPSGASIGFFGAAVAAQQASGANLTNSVTSGGTTDTIADFTSLTVYATDAATIRNDIYQLARKLKQVNDALRLYGLLT